MEATREIYWNIGHGAVIPMYMLVMVASGLMLKGFWQRVAASTPWGGTTRTWGWTSRWNTTAPTSTACWMSDRLTLTPEPFSFTYHDSCYLGRYMDIIDQPRSILTQAGGRITEMDKSGYDSFCCSAGGGRILAEEKLGSRISEARVQMATDTGCAASGIQLPLLPDHVRGRHQDRRSGRKASSQRPGGDRGGTV